MTKEDIVRAMLIFRKKGLPIVFKVDVYDNIEILSSDGVNRYLYENPTDGTVGEIFSALDCLGINYTVEHEF